MRTRNKGKVFALVLICVLTVLNASSVFAAVIVYGSEAKGYMVASRQLRTDTATYDASALDSTYKSYALAGAKLWNNTDVVEFKQSKNSPNKLYMYKDGNTDIHAFCRILRTSTSGKILSYEIKYNKSNMGTVSSKANNITAAHEFGHALGLQDLYKQNNRSQIMYGYLYGSKATKPSAKDIKGAKYATRK